MHLPCAESEPRDAGTDQKSSGIIRLHTIKQIIDRVSESTFPHTFKCTGKRRRYKHLLVDFRDHRKMAARQSETQLTAAPWWHLL